MVVREAGPSCYGVGPRAYPGPCLEVMNTESRGQPSIDKPFVKPQVADRNGNEFRGRCEYQLQGRSQSARSRIDFTTPSAPGNNDAPVTPS